MTLLEWYGDISRRKETQGILNERQLKIPFEIRTQFPVLTKYAGECPSRFMMEVENRGSRRLGIGSRTPATMYSSMIIFFEVEHILLSMKFIPLGRRRCSFLQILENTRLRYCEVVRFLCWAGFTRFLSSSWLCGNIVTHSRVPAARSH